MKTCILFLLFIVLQTEQSKCYLTLCLIDLILIIFIAKLSQIVIGFSLFSFTAVEQKKVGKWTRDLYDPLKNFKDTFIIVRI